MAKFSVITLTILIFALSFYYGNSLSKDKVQISTSNENIGEAIGRINKILEKKSLITSKKKLALGLERVVAREQINKFKENPRYKTLAHIAGIKTLDNALLDTIIGLENPKEIDHEIMEEINKALQAYLKDNPDKGFDEIKNILASDFASREYSLRGNLMVAASFIQGKESEVKEITLREIENNIIAPEKTDIPIGKRDFSSTNPDRGKDMAVVLAYNAYLAASHSDLKNVDDDTIDILKKQPNESVRRMIAMTYDRAYPSERANMLKRLEEEGINLFPKDFEFPDAKE